MKTRSCVVLALLAFAPNLAAQRLIGADSSRGLYRIDPATGARTQIGMVSANVVTPVGLAHDPASDTLWVGASGNGSLYTLELATGVATLVGAYGDPSLIMHGLEWDSSTGTLYGASQHDGGIYRIDTGTGAATLIGTTGLTGAINLGYDMHADVLYATDRVSDSLYAVDRATGAVTLIGPLSGALGAQALAYDCHTRTMMLLDNLTDDLYSVDLATGQSTSIGSMGSSNMLGLVYLSCTATWREFGAGCSGAAGVPVLGSTDLPVAGLDFSATVSHVPAPGVAFGAIGFSATLLGGTVPLPVDLGVIGMPGCEMLVDPLLSQGLAPVGGTATWTLPLPVSAVGLEFHMQAYVVDPLANALGLTLSNGGSARVGL